jgi:hypothetical protein
MEATFQRGQFFNRQISPGSAGYSLTRGKCRPLAVFGTVFADQPSLARPLPFSLWHSMKERSLHLENLIMMRKAPLRRLAAVLAVMSLATLFAVRQACADETHHEGTLINVGFDRIVILTQDRLSSRVFPLGSLVKVTKNGYEAHVRDLARGDLVLITAEVRLGTEVVVAIDVIPTG